MAASPNILWILVAVDLRNDSGRPAFLLRRETLQYLDIERETPIYLRARLLQLPTSVMIGDMPHMAGTSSVNRHHYLLPKANVHADPGEAGLLRTKASPFGTNRLGAHRTTWGGVLSENHGY